MRPNIKEFEELWSIMGLMTLSWGWAEYVLGYIIATIIEQTGAIHGNPEPPVSLKKRVKALRRALRDVTILQPFKEEGTLLAERFLEIGNRRNNLVHSAAIQTHKGTFEALSLKVIGGKNVIEVYSFNKTHAVTLESEIAKLSDDATAFMTKLAEFFRQ